MCPLVTQHSTAVVNIYIIFYSISGIPYCGTFARIIASIYTILALFLVIGSMGFSYHGMYETDMFNPMLAPFTGNESYASIIRGI